MNATILSIRPGRDRLVQNMENGSLLDHVRGLSNFDLADRLVHVWCRNERRLGKLDVLAEDIASIRRRLATPGASRGLAEAKLQQLIDTREECLAEAHSDERLAAALVQEWRSRHLDPPALRLAAGG
ncbi:hypothetical protein [Paludisphaera rhizosphaerae]|uniref:hypothetical protein n=1 Tax=Paludisphaera rhizosphaerae TaxID=2711216 RepID=UPI0013EE327D|nr:hypothetical protein [Paludisphaera rhizosphaerae]